MRLLKSFGSDSARASRYKVCQLWSGIGFPRRLGLPTTKLYSDGQTLRLSPLRPAELRQAACIRSWLFFHSAYSSARSRASGPEKMVIYNWSSSSKSGASTRQTPRLRLSLKTVHSIHASMQGEGVPIF